MSKKHLEIALALILLPVLIFPAAISEEVISEAMDAPVDEVEWELVGKAGDADMPIELEDILPLATAQADGDVAINAANFPEAAYANGSAGT